MIVLKRNPVLQECRQNNYRTSFQMAGFLVPKGLERNLGPLTVRSFGIVVGPLDVPMSIDWECGLSGTVILIDQELEVLELGMSGMSGKGHLRSRI